MKSSIVRSILVAALLVVATRGTLVVAEDMTVNSILVAYKAGATVDGLTAMVNSPVNSVTATPEDLATLRANGIPESILTALAARVANPAPPAIQPDDSRLVDVVRLDKSGISQSIVAEQVRQSGRAFNLSVQDLLYLKQNGVQESTIALLQATQDHAPGAMPTTASGTPAPPKEMTFQDLVLESKGLLSKNRPGRLVLHAQTLTWVDGDDPTRNFDIEINGLEKVWLTCKARTPENFCYQINFEIVKGPRYHFQDANQESGSNASIEKVMQALRAYFPKLTYGAPDA